MEGVDDWLGVTRGLTLDGGEKEYSKKEAKALAMSPGVFNSRLLKHIRLGIVESK